MTTPPIVLSVGQCSADDYRLARLVKTHLDAHLDRAATFDEALQKIAHQTYALILVNRILDADGASGIDLITQARFEPIASQSPFLLISDYPEAQSQARAAGAFPGFGKSDLAHPQVAQLLRQALAARSEP